MKTVKQLKFTKENQTKNKKNSFEKILTQNVRVKVSRKNPVKTYTYVCIHRGLTIVRLLTDMYDASVCYYSCYHDFCNAIYEVCLILLLTIIPLNIAYDYS